MWLNIGIFEFPTSKTTFSVRGQAKTTKIRLEWKLDAFIIPLLCTGLWPLTRACSPQTENDTLLLSRRFNWKWESVSLWFALKVKTNKTSPFKVKIILNTLWTLCWTIPLDFNKTVIGVICWTFITIYKHIHTGKVHPSRVISKVIIIL